MTEELEPAAFRWKRRLENGTFDGKDWFWEHTEFKPHQKETRKNTEIQPLFAAEDIIRLIRKLRDEENNYGESEDRIEEAVEAGHACALDRLEEIFEELREAE